MRFRYFLFILVIIVFSTMYQYRDNREDRVENPQSQNTDSGTDSPENRHGSMRTSDTNRAILMHEPASKSAVNQSIARIEKELSEIRRQVNDLQIAVTQDGDSQTDRIPPEELQDPSVRQSMMQAQLALESNALDQIDDRYRKFNEQFQAQPIDTRWAPEATSTIKSLFYQIDPNGTGLSGVECRQTWCRMEVVHDNREAVGDFDMKFMRVLDGAFNTIGISPAQEDNAYLQVYYLKRV